MHERAALSRTLAVTLALAGFALPVRAQPRADHATWTMGFGAGAFLPMGEFDRNTDPSLAWEGFISVRPAGVIPWGGRLTFQFTEYARSDTTFALPGLAVDTRTGSDILWTTLGPEVLLGGGTVRGLFQAGVGIAWARTQTSVRGTFTNATNFDDIAVACEAGAAVSWRLLRSELLRLELGGRWIGTGPLDHVPGTGIDRAAGELVLSPRQDPMGGAVLRAVLGVALY